MNKQEFMTKLKYGLAGLPQEDIDERLSFYGEMIDDRMEEGLSEEDAVAEIGSVDKIISQIISDTPLKKIVKEKVRPKRALKAWEIALIILGAPLWIPLLIAAVAVVFSVYIVIWSLIISLFAVEFSLAVSAVLLLVSFFVYAFSGSLPSGIAVLGASLFCFGTAILLFFACVSAAKGTVKLTKRITLGIKSSFVR